MIALLWLFLALFASPFKSNSRLEAGNAALRHRLIILRRKRLYGQVGRFLALEDALNVRGRAPMQVDRIGPVGDETSICDETA